MLEDTFLDGTTHLKQQGKRELIDGISLFDLEANDYFYSCFLSYIPYELCHDKRFFKEYVYWEGLHI